MHEFGRRVDSATTAGRCDCLRPVGAVPPDPAAVLPRLPWIFMCALSKGMTTTMPEGYHLDPRNIFLDAEQVHARSGWARTVGYPARRPVRAARSATPVASRRGECDKDARRPTTREASLNLRACRPFVGGFRGRLRKVLVLCRYRRRRGRVGRTAVAGAVAVRRTVAEDDVGFPVAVGPVQHEQAGVCGKFCERRKVRDVDDGQVG